MSRLKIKVKDITELIEQYNPFAFKDGKGRIMAFPSYNQAYYELFSRLYKAGPKMVDAVLFAIDTWGMSLQDAQRFIASWKMVVGQESSDFFFDWQHGGAERDKTLERFAKGMHLISETKFNSDMFRDALTRFKISIGVIE